MNKQKNCIIDMKNISFEYIRRSADGQEILGEQKVLEGFNIKIFEGSFIAIKGANGVGLTTLGRLICGKLIPGEGDMTVCGYDIFDASEREEIKKIVGMTESNPAEYFTQTLIREEAAYSWGKELLRITGLYEKKNSTIDKLSYGEKSCLGIASVLASKPRIAVFDQAAAGIDKDKKIKIIDYIAGLCEKEGLTAIWLTNNSMEEGIINVNNPEWSGVYL
ncbi:MAG: ATP-binding cassette domain-containing protein [Eubacterium sp.]|nr:ATP-binding cassette domain-containing protein [Eubacterium sp.]